MARSRRSKTSILPFGRLLGPPLSIAVLIGLGYLAMSGQLPFFNKLSELEAVDSGISRTTSFRFGATDPSPDRRPTNSVSIATFNIDVFGKSDDVSGTTMETVVRILRQFDVIALQAIQWKTREPMERLLQQVNESGDQYQVVVSEPLGTQADQQQYAFIWNSNRIDLVKDSVYLVDDSAELMLREPYVASFLSKPAVGSDQPFSFTLINVHADISTDRKELDVLDDVYQSVRAFQYPEDDVIVLGDLVSETTQFGEFGGLMGMQSINREATNVSGDRSVDHIIIDRYATTEFRNAGVIHYERDLELTREQADQISSHRPVWAVFDVSEHAQQGILATLPGTQTQ